jgi:two-component system, OmpR family, response regulator MprA
MSESKADNSTENQVLLVGRKAEALAARLVASGYLPMGESALGTVGRVSPEGVDAPEAILISPDCEPRIPELRGRWGQVPMLLGIETDSVEERSQCLLSGADDFWLTNLGPSDLLTRLRLHLNRVQGQLPSARSLQVADLRVNTEIGQVKRGQRQLKLTEREYQLLLLLLQHQDKVVGRSLIMREIWEDQQTSGSNVIEVYVRYLRQKMESGGERRLIHTVRGQGYCLSAGPAPATPVQQ